MKDARARAVIDAAANGWLGTKDTALPSLRQHT
jgi:hypothetical protein